MLLHLRSLRNAGDTEGARINLGHVLTCALRRARPHQQRRSRHCELVERGRVLEKGWQIVLVIRSRFGCGYVPCFFRQDVQLVAACGGGAASVPRVTGRTWARWRSERGRQFVSGLISHMYGLVARGSRVQVRRCVRPNGIRAMSDIR